MLRYAPLFIALLVWLTRVSLISSVALALERLAATGSGQRSGSTRSRGSLDLPSQSPIRERQRNLAFSSNGRDETEHE
jgi:hypothetical protein